MNDESHSSAFCRAGIVVVGFVSIGFALYFLKPLFGTIATFLANAGDSCSALGQGNWLILIGVLLGPSVLLATGLILIRRADFIAVRLFSHAALTAEVVIYRTIFAGIGLLLLTTGFARLATLIGNVALKFFSDSPIPMGESAFWPWVISSALNFSLGLYLFLGAPRLLGWHLGRCEKIDKEDRNP